MRTNSGVSGYMTGLGAASVFGAHPKQKVASPMLKWATHETAKGVFSATVENTLKADIDYCHDNGKGLLLRTSAGTDSPVGRNGTTQKDWLLARGVDVLETWDNDPTPTLYNKQIRVPDLVSPASASQYLDDMIDWFTRLATILAANDKGGHPRWNHVAFLTVPGPEDGTEMPLGYGSLGDTVYSNCGTLTNLLPASGAGSMSFQLTGPSGATGASIYLIGNEVLHVLSRSGSTVTVGRRGHSGTAAASHSAGTQVKIGTSKVTVGTYKGYTAPYDHRRLNKAQWAPLGSESACRSAIADYWQDACLAIAGVLPSEVGISIAGGAVFDDGGDAADAILEVVGPALGTRFVGGSTNFVDSYSSVNPRQHAWLLRCIELGCRTFLQTGGVTRLGEPPAAGAMQRFVRVGVEALAYDPWIFETGARRFIDRATDGTLKADDTSAVAWWPGGSATTQSRFMIGQVA